MSIPVSALPAGVQGGGVGVQKVTINTRVKTATAPIGLFSDVMQMSGPSITGNWVVSATRVQVMNTLVINQTCTGIAVPPPPLVPVPMAVTQGDPRVKVM